MIKSKLIPASPRKFEIAGMSAPGLAPAGMPFEHHRLYVIARYSGRQFGAERGQNVIV
jgi:hypothetical protein